MLIEVKGVQFANKGAELMLRAILERVRASFPDAQFTIAPNLGSCPYESLAALGVYPKLWLQRKGIQWGYVANKLPKRMLRMCGLRADAEVDIVLDASGFAYGDQWGPRNTVQMARALRRWKKQRTRVLLLPQAFGPFSGRAIRKAFRRVARHADAIYARESASYDHIVEVAGEFAHLREAPDFTVLLPGTTPEWFDGGTCNVAIIPNARMMDKTDSATAKSYVSFLAQCVREFDAHEYKPFFLLHGGRHDEELAREAERLVEFEVPIIQEQDAVTVKGVIRGCKAVVSSRYHGLVSALSQCIPALGTSWSHKYRLLFEQYGCPDLLLSPDEENNGVRDAVSSFVQDLAFHSRELARAAEQHRIEASQMWDEVVAIMKASR